MTPEVVNGSGARSAPNRWFGASSTCVCVTKIIPAVDAALKRCWTRSGTGHEVMVSRPVQPRNAAADAWTPSLMVYMQTNLKPSRREKMQAKRSCLRASLSLTTTQITAEVNYLAPPAYPQGRGHCY